MSIGTARTRVEGPAKVTGAAKYAADNHPMGLLHGVFVGSPIAYGTVIAIDAAEALRVPGVLRVLTAADMPRFGEMPPIIAEVSKPPMQGDWIEWEGQPVALVLAESLEAAEEAAALVRVSVEALEPIVPGRGEVELPPQEPAPTQEAKGDVEAGLAEAAVMISQDYYQPTRHHNPMETSATVASWTGDRLTLWSATQHGWASPPVMAAAFGIDPANVHQVTPHTGGAFGVKSFVAPHEILTAAAARIVGRPVHVALTRPQMYAQMGHQSEVRQTVTLGAAADGTLTAIRHTGVNTTALSQVHVENGTQSSRGNYASPNIELDHRIERINTTVPVPMRAPVEGPGSWALESALDELAVELGMDPLDVRLANYAEEHPMEGRPWSSKKLREAYAEADEAYGWRSRAERPREDGHWAIGHGLGGAGMFCARFGNTARVRVHSSGRVTVESGSNDIGTGSQTICVLAAAEALGVSPDLVDVRWGDTSLPRTSGVYGSSHTMGIGSAVIFAARNARRRLAALGGPAEGPLDLAAILGAAGVSEVVGEGRFDPNLPDLGERSTTDPFANGPFSFNFGGMNTPYAMQTFGVTMVEVGVDRDLGLIRLRRAVARYSVGTIVNPLTARSQMIGGIIWEWGKATMEASVIEPRHGRFLSKNLSGVAIPVNADIPADIDVGFVDEFDRHASAFGGKGIGELGSTGVAAAIANAVYDAVGVRVRQVPILPHHVLEGLEA